MIFYNGIGVRHVLFLEVHYMVSTIGVKATSWTYVDRY